MSNQLEALKNKIKEILSELKEEEEELKKEVTTTGDVAGYDTPRAFAKDGKHTSDYVKRMAALTGYSSLTENRFHKLRLDNTLTPNQKIGLSQAEIDCIKNRTYTYILAYKDFHKNQTNNLEHFYKREDYL